MTPFLRTSTLSIFVLGLVLALSACSAQPPAPASVDGKAISETELETAAGVVSALTGIQQLPCGDAPEEGESQEAACNRFSLGTLIQFRLAEGYASANGVTVDESVVESVIEEFEGAVGPADFQVQLDENGVTHDDFVDFVRVSLLQDEVARALVVEVIGEDGLRQRYDERVLDFTVIEVDHILLETEEEAWDAYDKVTAPGSTREDFMALAFRISKDPSVEDNSGAMPPTPASQFVETFAQAAIALGSDEISEPVKTDFGWHVIHLVSKEVASFEDARDSMIGQEIASTFSDWIKGRAAEGTIDVDPGFGRFDAELMTVVRITSTDPSATTALPSEPVNAAPQG